jgi:hypothetical protein
MAYNNLPCTNVQAVQNIYCKMKGFKILIETTATTFKNSVVIGHWYENAKVTAIKQQKSK